MSEPTLPAPGNILRIEELPSLFASTLDNSYCALMVKSCVFTLNEFNHAPGVVLKSNKGKGNLFKQPVRLEWSMPVTAQMKNTFQDENRTTDFAAMCIAVLFIRLLTSYQFVFPSKLGSGVDFWLTNDPTGVTWESRLEVSGIKKETPANTVAKRVREKRMQVAKSAGLTKSAYIAVIEFSNPQAIFLQS